MLIQEILLVTFTESAAAELKERTARFIRSFERVDVKAEASATDKTFGECKISQLLPLRSRM
jgi:ATP-dependent exoDNAse (exonuclease V) beta subunit